MKVPDIEGHGVIISRASGPATANTMSIFTVQYEELQEFYALIFCSFHGNSNFWGG